MSNSAVIKGVGSSVGVYLHHHGLFEYVYPLLHYCKLKGYGDPYHYNGVGTARLCQVAANWIGGELDVSIKYVDAQPTEEQIKEYNYEQGVYEVIDHWEIETHYGYDGKVVTGEFMEEAKLINEMCEINYSQPRCEQVTVSTIVSYVREYYENMKKQLDISSLISPNAYKVVENGYGLPRVLHHVSDGVFNVAEVSTDNMLIASVEFTLDKHFDMTEIDIKTVDDLWDKVNECYDNDNVETYQHSDYWFTTSAIKRLEAFFSGIELNLSRYYGTYNRYEIEEYISTNYDLGDDGRYLLSGAIEYCNDFSDLIGMTYNMLNFDDIDMFRNHLDVEW